MTQVLEKSNTTLTVIPVKKPQKDSDYVHVLRTSDVETVRHCTKKDRNINGINRGAVMNRRSMKIRDFHGLPFNSPFGVDAMNL